MRALLVVALVGLLGLAACGSSKKAATPTTTVDVAGEAIETANLPGVGTVLANGVGVTLYILTSEQGGKLTCTDSNGCTKVWPDVTLPIGTPVATAENGTVASKLGIVKNSSGEVIVTYAGFPLHTFSGDSGPGHANGQGVSSFGGTWETITPAGVPVTATSG